MVLQEWTVSGNVVDLITIRNCKSFPCVFGTGVLAVSSTCRKSSSSAHISAHDHVVVRPSATNCLERLTTHLVITTSFSSLSQYALGSLLATSPPPHCTFDCHRSFSFPRTSIHHLLTILHTVKNDLWRLPLHLTAPPSSVSHQRIRF